MKWFKSNKENQRKNPQQPVKNYLGLYAGLTIGLMTTAYLISPYGKVGDMYVEGDSIVPEQLILDASKITQKQTVVGTLVSEEAIEAEIIAALPQVKSVKVQWQKLNDIVLEIQDYETIAYLNDANEYNSVLENGFIVNEAHKIPIGNKPLLTKFEQGPILNELIVTFKEISKDIQNSISEIKYMGTKTNPYKISIMMNDGNQIIANITDFSKKIGYYPDMLQKLDGKKGTFDMEVGVFFTPFNSKAQEEIDIETDSQE
ncbi:MULTISPECIES: cell division protein FtsQ/DivIB [unclassified Jeotgalibaca]|uniref:cell division protein FtsQ/DivIB n=1 Tax=unclassified Jeotgalibaca TaxID=2621505 RepID=UPI003FD3B92D